MWIEPYRTTQRCSTRRLRGSRRRCSWHRSRHRVSPSSSRRGSPSWRACRRRQAGSAHRARRSAVPGWSCSRAGRDPSPTPCCRSRSARRSVVVQRSVFATQPLQPLLATLHPVSHDELSNSAAGGVADQLVAAIARARKSPGVHVTAIHTRSPRRRSRRRRRRTGSWDRCTSHSCTRRARIRLRASHHHQQRDPLAHVCVHHIKGLLRACRNCIGQLAESSQVTADRVSACSGILPGSSSTSPIGACVRLLLAHPHAPRRSTRLDHRALG